MTKHTFISTNLVTVRCSIPYQFCQFKSSLKPGPQNSMKCFAATFNNISMSANLLVPKSDTIDMNQIHQFR